MPQVVDLNAVRLYQPDNELRGRLGDDTLPLSNFIKAIQTAASDYLTANPQQDAHGLLIAVGVKPLKKSRIWCEAVAGSIPADLLRDLELHLGKIEAIEVHHAPIAFAIELRLWGKEVDKFPVIPEAWIETAKQARRGLEVPDELFNILWPD